MDLQQDGAVAVFLGPGSEALDGGKSLVGLCDPGEWVHIQEKGAEVGGHFLPDAC